MDQLEDLFPGQVPKNDPLLEMTKTFFIYEFDRGPIRSLMALNCLAEHDAQTVEGLRETITHEAKAHATLIMCAIHVLCHNHLTSTFSWNSLLEEKASKVLATLPREVRVISEAMLPFRSLVAFNDWLTPLTEATIGNVRPAPVRHLNEPTLLHLMNQASPKDFAIPPGVGFLDITEGASAIVSQDHVSNESKIHALLSTFGHLFGLFQCKVEFKYESLRIIEVKLASRQGFDRNAFLEGFQGWTLEWRTCIQHLCMAIHCIGMYLYQKKCVVSEFVMTKESMASITAQYEEIRNMRVCALYENVHENDLGNMRRMGDLVQSGTAWFNPIVQQPVGVVLDQWEKNGELARKWDVKGLMDDVNSYFFHLKDPVHDFSKFSMMDMDLDPAETLEFINPIFSEEGQQHFES
jgi:hypothetical protein